MAARLILLILLTALTAAPQSLAQDKTAPENGKTVKNGIAEADSTGRKAAPGNQEKELTLDEILEGFYNAIGGRESWTSVNTMLMRGSRFTGGNRLRVKAMYMRPNKCVVEFSLKKDRIVQSYDGKTGWTQSTLGKNTDPQVMSSRKAQYFHDTCDIGGPLMNYKKIGAELTFTGKTQLYGEQVYKIGINFKSGNKQTYYIDEKTFLPVRMDGEYMLDGDENTRITTTFSDYKSTGDYVLPHTLEFDTEGKDSTERLIFDTILFNVNIDDSLFSMPGSR